MGVGSYFNRVYNKGVYKRTHSKAYNKGPCTHSKAHNKGHVTTLSATWDPLYLQFCGLYLLIFRVPKTLKGIRSALSNATARGELCRV